MSIFGKTPAKWWCTEAFVLAGYATATLGACWSYSADNLTDGYISEALIDRIVPRDVDWRRDVDVLVQRGLMVVVPGGWDLIGYLDFNRSAIQVLDDRHREAERVRRRRWKAAHGGSLKGFVPRPLPSQRGGPSRPSGVRLDVPRPDRSPDQVRADQGSGKKREEEPLDPLEEGNPAADEAFNRIENAAEEEPAASGADVRPDVPGDVRREAPGTAQGTPTGAPREQPRAEGAPPAPAYVGDPPTPEEVFQTLTDAARAGLEPVTNPLEQTRLTLAVGHLAVAALAQTPRKLTKRAVLELVRLVGTELATPRELFKGWNVVERHGRISAYWLLHSDARALGQAVARALPKMPQAWSDDPAMRGALARARALQQQALEATDAQRKAG